MPNAKIRRCATGLLLFLCVTVQALPVLEKPVTLYARNQPIGEILNEVSRQTGVQFSYSPQAVDVSQQASLDAHNLPVKEALRQVLGSKYEYKVVRKFIILRKSRIEIFPSTPQQQRPDAEKIEYSYITNQRYVKKLCYTDSGTTLDDCLIITNNKNYKVMKTQLTAIALAAATSVSAQAQQPSTVSGQLEKAGKEFIVLIKEVVDNTAQAVTITANEINRQALGLKTADTSAAAQADTSPAAAQADTPPAAAQADSVHPVIFTLFYPFSFPELNAERHIYQTSFTWLVGLNGGVTGVEVGWMINANRYQMSGVQVAGCSNLSLGSVTGTQIAGFANLAVKDTADAQVAGVVNVAQSADFQMAGIANAAYHNGRVQLAGVANSSTKGATAAQLAGVANAAQSADFQAAGVANAAYRDAKVQLAGIANVTDTSRCQIGLVNAARKAGVQIGLVNVCDATDGVMIGLVNVAQKGGLRELEIGAGIDQVNVAYRMGIKKFYTFAELSYRWNESLWLTGVGLGTQITLPKGWGMNIEGLSQNVLTNRFWERNGVTRLAQARVTAVRQLAKHFAVFAGPTFSVSCTNFTDSNAVDLRAPYHIFSVRGNHIATKAWVGFSAGVRIN
ncbi:MAG: STN domain-containing protein [Prevotellaceae bacterium]|jgi:hypothetical protein|nr:STN domain-containing protein [Prevotellaceae bacterium]